MVNGLNYISNITVPGESVTGAVMEARKREAGSTESGKRAAGVGMETGKREAGTGMETGKCVAQTGTEAETGTVGTDAYTKKRVRTGRYEEKKASGNNAYTIRMMQSKRAAMKKKKLNYNRREVSSQVLRATKISSAAKVLATARSKVGSLRRCLGSGQYDDGEVRVAINHAERIVKAAKDKLSNLKEEQRKERRAARAKQSSELKKQVKKQRIRAERIQLKQEQAIEKGQAERSAKEEELRLKQLKHRHRSEELSDITKADLEYLKDMQRLQKDGSAGSEQREISAVTLEIGDSAMRLSELARTEQALKYEEMQLDTQSVEVLDGLTGEVVGGSDFSDAQSAGSGSVPDVGGTVDISV